MVPDVRRPDQITCSDESKPTGASDFEKSLRDSGQKRRRCVEKILVIYDDPGSVKTLCGILELGDYNVIALAAGPLALKVLRATNPGLVVLDVLLPVQSSQNTCREIRNESEHVPLFVLSASRDVEDVVQLLGVGADDCITKPFNIQEFLARVRAALRRAAVIQYSNR